MKPPTMSNLRVATKFLEDSHGFLKVDRVRMLAQLLGEHEERARVAAAQAVTSACIQFDARLARRLEEIVLGSKPTGRRERAAANVRYWLDHNTFGMGEHDRRVLRECLDALEGKAEGPLDGSGVVPPPEGSR